MRGRHLLLIPVALTFLVVYLPLVAVVLFSFKSSPAIVMPISDFTTDWYGVLWRDSEVHAALRNSLILGAATVGVTLVLATPVALALRGRRFRGRGAYEFVIGMPFLLPEIVTGLALLTFFTQVDIDLSKMTIVIGHVLFVVGAAFRIIAARVETLPTTMEEAARDLGRGAVGSFVYATLPGLWSALAAAALIVFVLSFDQTVITIFLTGVDNTLPTLLWAKMRIGFTPELNALATVLLGITAVLAIPIAFMLARRGAVEDV